MNIEHELAQMKEFVLNKEVQNALYQIAIILEWMVKEIRNHEP